LISYVKILPNSTSLTAPEKGVRAKSEESRAIKQMNEISCTVLFARIRQTLFHPLIFMKYHIVTENIPFWHVTCEIQVRSSKEL
jgi:hypothetical protein